MKKDHGFGRIGNGGLLKTYLWTELISFLLEWEAALLSTMDLKLSAPLLDPWFQLWLLMLVLSIALLTHCVINFYKFHFFFLFIEIILILISTLFSFFWEIIIIVIVINMIWDIAQIASIKVYFSKHFYHHLISTIFSRLSRMNGTYVIKILTFCNLFRGYNYACLRSLKKLYIYVYKKKKKLYIYYFSFWTC